MDKNPKQNSKEKRLANLKPPFSKDNQPDPKLKSQGWERKREAQKIMDKMMELKDWTWEQMLEMKDDIKKHPEKYTVLEVKLADYLSREKFTVDFLDRHISKAPQEITGEDGKEIVLRITSVPKDDDNGRTGDTTSTEAGGSLAENI